jgi:hypothetical protein
MKTPRCSACLGDCDLDGWIEALREVFGIGDQNRGAWSRAGQHPARGELRKFMIAPATAVSGSIAAGAFEDTTVEEARLPAVAHLPRYREWLKPNVRSVYRYFTLNDR